MTSLAVIIPSRDLHGMLRSCIGALRESIIAASAIKSHEILVLDNASSRPYSPRDIVGASTIRFDMHQSFSRCCNAGVGGTTAEFILFLNNDVVLARKTVEFMLETMVEKRADIVGTLLEFPNGTVQHAGVGFPSPTPINLGRETDSSHFLDHVKPVPAVTGAAMMVRRSALIDLGGFDERFAFGHEDVDLCLRARASGQTVWLDCRSRSLHFESMTPGRTAFEEESRLAFLAKWSERLTIEEGLS
jgi:GT2 family glycosyltransferase